MSQNDLVLSHSVSIPADFVVVSFRAQVFHAAAGFPFVAAAAGKQQLSPFVDERDFRRRKTRFHFTEDHATVLTFPVYVVDLGGELRGEGGGEFKPEVKPKMTVFQHAIDNNNKDDAYDEETATTKTTTITLTATATSQQQQQKQIELWATETYKRKIEQKAKNKKKKKTRKAHGKTNRNAHKNKQNDSRDQLQ